MRHHANSRFGSAAFRMWWTVALAAGLEGLGGAGAAPAAPNIASCGDATADGVIAASDALLALRTAVGKATCPLLVCDVDESGNVTTKDAIAILKMALGWKVVLHCPPPDPVASTTTTTTTTTSTTSMTGTCGDGTVDPDEECDPLGGFCRGGCSPYTKICVDFGCQDDCSCPKPVCGDYLIDPNESCDPPGSPCESGTCDADCQCAP